MISYQRRKFHDTRVISSIRTQEFIAENMSINSGSREFWEEIFHLFAKHSGTRIDYKGTFHLHVSSVTCA